MIYSGATKEGYSHVSRKLTRNHICPLKINHKAAAKIISRIASRSISVLLITSLAVRKEYNEVMIVTKAP